jgi:hypothetical protein
MNLEKHIFNDIEIYLFKNQEFEFLLSTQEVAKGFGVSEVTVRRQKSNHSDELFENKHFVVVQKMNEQNFKVKLDEKVTQQTFWTKRGIVRLGFFIKSERAKQFRDWAEDLILEEKKTSKNEISKINFDLDSYILENEKLIKLVKLITSENTITLHYLDKLTQSLNLKSPLELLKIDLNSHYFIPTELGKILDKSAVEINKILEHKGYQIKVDEHWELTESGKEFAISVKNKL